MKQDLQCVFGVRQACFTIVYTLGLFHNLIQHLKLGLQMNRDVRELYLYKLLHIMKIL